MIEHVTQFEHHDEVTGFRPIHYLGNKSRILDSIQSAIEALAGADKPVCDLFTGSGVVAQRLASQRAVFAADIQEYSRVVTSALLSPTHLPSGLVSWLMQEAEHQLEELRVDPIHNLVDYEQFAIDEALADRPDALCNVLEYGSISAYMSEGATTRVADALFDRLSNASRSLPHGPNTVMTRYYGGLYFGYQQALTIDSIASAVRKLPVDFRDTAMAALLSATSDIVATIGNQFAQPVRPRTSDGRPKRQLVAGVARKRRRSFADLYLDWLTRYQALPLATAKHTVIRADYRDVLLKLPSDIAAIYADPPYTRDHYSRFYHVLETIALGDEPQISTMNIGGKTQLSRALYRVDRHQSPFCIKTEVRPAFRFLFSEASRLEVPLVVSYSPHSPGTVSRPLTRLLNVDELVAIAGDYFSDVTIESAGRIAHSKLNSERLNAESSHEAEMLIIARP